MRCNIEELWLKAIRLYTFNTPINKGKYRLFQAALKACRCPHHSLPVVSRDGRRFLVDLSTGMQDHLYFFGEYEKAISNIASRLIKPGYHCLDVGANFGWYSTLMALETGDAGSVHAFEPVPASFDLLSRNLALSPRSAIVTIEQLALGDREDVISIKIAEGEPSGHASIAEKGDGGEGFDCPMMTFDDYRRTNALADLDFVKVDIEGAEMMFLKGAGTLFDQQVPPIFQMEMALEQSRYFGYLPDDLIKFIGERGEYEFYRVNEAVGTMSLINGFADADIGGNVFCIPTAVSKEAVNDLIVDR